MDYVVRPTWFSTRPTLSCGYEVKMKDEAQREHEVLMQSREHFAGFNHIAAEASRAGRRNGNELRGKAGSD